MKKWIWKIIAVFTCVLCMPLSVKADSGSLTLHYEVGKGSFALYRVAGFSETGKFSVEEPFAQYPVDWEHLENLDSEGWRALSETLSGYVSRDSELIKPIDVKTVDEKGDVVWNPLEKGLYLIIGEQVQDEQYTYTPIPFLVTVPNRTESGAWNPDPVVEPKYEKEEIRNVNRTVLKIWKDDGNKALRPEEITVQLLMDGEVYATIQLNEENNWKYHFTDLPAGHEWKIVEKTILKSYTVTSTQDGETFVITNTCTEEIPKQPQEPKLPQTGQLWWPVPILVIAGLAAFAIGWIRSRKWNDRNEK